MSIKRKLVSVLLLVLTSKSFCQKIESPNAPFVYMNTVQIELLGYNMLYWINYERFFINGQNYKTTGQIGLNYSSDTYHTQYRVPVMITEIKSFKKHHIEMGLGCVFIKTWIRRDFVNLSNYTVFSMAGHIRIGYRYQKPNGRFLFKISFTPLLTRGFFSKTIDPLEFNPSGSLTFGYCF
jgi:hypothetical protein